MPDSERTGKQLRETLKRSTLAVSSERSRRNPIRIITKQNTNRLRELVPVRIGRMLQSPFAFYRGTAAIMAADLAADPTTDLRVVSCGDAHISNFGFFASPERSLLFDLNDFDEAGIAPFEWDLKRLTASVYIGGRSRGLSEDDCADAATLAAGAYRRTLRNLVELPATERYFARVDETSLEELITDKKARKAVRRTTTKARKRTSEQVLRKITTTTEDGEIRIVDQPPVMEHVDHASLAQLRILYQRYRRTLRSDVSMLLEQFTPVDYALRVVGVGSVGTRCYVIALQDPHGETLFLQAKEAGSSVLSSYGGMPETIPGKLSRAKDTSGERVVACQRILQSQSDPFLGWIVGWAGDRANRPKADFYWRQFRDMKGAVDVDSLKKSQFIGYGRICGGMLARAHSQSPAARTAADYLGKSTVADEALAQYSRAYADRSEADFEALGAAVKDGTLPAESGV